MGEVIAENGLEPDIRYRHKISSVAVGPVVSRPERCPDHCGMLAVSPGVRRLPRMM
jgi:hypothetical protein